MDPQTISTPSVGNPHRGAVVATIIILLLVVSVFYYLWKNQSTPADTALQPVQNVAEQLPETNPLQNTNPIDNAYKNPFE